MGASAQAGIRVEIRGLGSEERDNVRARLGIQRAADAKDAKLDPAEVQRLHEQAEQDIITAMQPFGWYNIKVKSSLTGSAPDWRAEYTVDAGPETDISAVDIQVEGDGRDDAVLARASAHPHLPLGQRLKHSDYEAAKDHLLKAALGEGYLDAGFSRHELRVDVATHQAQVLLTLATGPRYYFGGVAVYQDGRLEDRLIRRYLTVVPGAPFDPAKVLSTQFALTDLDYFRSVEVETRKDQSGSAHTVPVAIRLSSKPPRDYRIGAGYGTDTGARALLGFDIRRLNEEGHRLHLELRPSEKLSTGVMDYKIPTGTTPGENVAFTLLGLKQTLTDGKEGLWSVGTSDTRVFGSWQRKIYLQYIHDNFAFDGEAGALSRLLVPGVSFTHSNLDDPIYPRLGWSVFLDTHGATTKVLSNAEFIQGHVQLRGVTPLMSQLRLLFRIEEGASAVSGFADLPPSQRFFAGGDDSVRGYAYQSLGPKDADGRVVGGRYLTTGSLELDWEVRRPYGLAAFVDGGGADDVPQVEMHYGAGLGLRYRAPFGAVGVDLAHPFDRGTSPVRLHLSVRVGL